MRWASLYYVLWHPCFTVACVGSLLHACTTAVPQLQQVLVSIAVPFTIPVQFMFAGCWSCNNLLLFSVAVAAASLEGNLGVCISCSVNSASSQHGSCWGNCWGWHISPRPCSGRLGRSSTALGAETEIEASALVSGMAAGGSCLASSCSATAACPGKLLLSTLPLTADSHDALVLPLNWFVHGLLSNQP